jgi:hypothetical protein
MLLTVVVAGCSTVESKEPAALYHGTMRSSCAPHDAPSTELRLEAVEGNAWLFLNLWPERGAVPPSTVRFDANRPIGQGAYCTGPDTCEPAEWGEIRLSVTPDNSGVYGEWMLGMQDAQVHRGAFEAEWLAIQAMCG